MYLCIFMLSFVHPFEEVDGKILYVGNPIVDSRMRLYDIRLFWGVCGPVWGNHWMCGYRYGILGTKKSRIWRLCCGGFDSFRHRSCRFRILHAKRMACIVFM